MSHPIAVAFLQLFAGTEALVHDAAVALAAGRETTSEAREAYGHKMAQLAGKIVALASLQNMDESQWRTALKLLYPAEQYRSSSLAARVSEAKRISEYHPDWDGTLREQWAEGNMATKGEHCFTQARKTADELKMWQGTDAQVMARYLSELARLRTHNPDVFDRAVEEFMTAPDAERDDNGIITRLAGESDDDDTQ